MSKTYSFRFNETAIYLNLTHITIPMAKIMRKELDEAIAQAEKYQDELVERRAKNLEDEIKQKQSELEAIRRSRLQDQDKKSGIEPYFEDYTPV